MISLYKQSIFRAFTEDQEILVGHMAVHTLCQSLVSFEDLLLEGIKHTKKLFLAWYTSTYTHTCMHADTAYTYTHTHEHTMHRHTPKHDIVLKGLLKSMTVLLILCG